MEASSNVNATAVSWTSPERRPLTVLLSTGFISMISNQLTSLAVPWFVLVLTGSAAKMGLTAAATMLPSIVMLFLGGAIADRTSPRKISIFADVLSSVTVAMVPLLYVLGHLNFTLLLALMVIGAVFDTPGYSARSKLLPELAERGLISIDKVTSLQGVMGAVSVLFGAILAGVLIGWLGATNVLWINAAAFAISALAMLLLIPEMFVAKQVTTSIAEDIRFGIRYVRNHEFLRTVLVISLVFNMLFAPMAAVLLPYLAKTEWQSAFWFGIVTSGLGAGAMIGSIAVGKLTERVSRYTMMRAAVLLLSVPLIGIGTVPPPWVAFIAFAVVGVGMGIVNPVMIAVFYRITEQSVLGRVMGVINAGSLIAQPLGVLLATPLLQKVGIGPSFYIVGALASLVALSIFLSPTIREIDNVVRQTEALPTHSHDD